MQDVTRGILMLLVMAIGIGVMVGFPFGAILKALSKWGIILLAIVIIAPMLPSVLDQQPCNFSSLSFAQTCTYPMGGEQIPHL